MAAIPSDDLVMIRRYCVSRVPAELHDQARVEATNRGNRVTIFDCRPPWHAELTDWTRVPVAQLRYDPECHLWSLFWADRNSRWHRYDEQEPGSVDRLLEEIDDDPTCIFWG